MKVIMTKTKNVFFGLMMAILLMATVTLQAHAGSIVAWGGDEYGQVSTTPVGADFTAIAAGGATSYALRSDGSIAAWGLDDLGQVSSAPTESDFMRIAVGYDHGYALRSDGSIAAWGNNDSGQVSSTPTEASFTAIAGGGRNGYALRADGSIAAWGNDDFDQVSTAPTEAGFTAIVAGFYHAYALRADGSIAAWGSDGESQVSGTPAETGFLDISAGSYHGYALRSDGSIAAWGSDFNLQVSGAPTGSGFKAIGSVAFHSYALRADGSIAAWGLNCDGQVFNTPTESSPGFTSIAAGGASGYALNAISIDLGDIVGGGNGLGTGVFLEGIDPRTGGTVGPTWAGYGNAGVSVFYDVVTNPLVDGVFVPSKAQATVMQGDDSTFGLGSLTIDTGQELEFLDVTLSLNRSFNDVSAQFGVGGDFAGFRYATNIELTSLVNNSGFTPTAVCCFFTQYGTYGEDTLGELVSLLGITQNSGFGSEYWQNRVLGFTGTPVRQGGDPRIWGAQLYDNPTAVDRADTFGPTSGAFSYDTIFDTWGSFLVRDQNPVPAPPTANVPTRITSTGLTFQLPGTNGSIWDAIRNGVSNMYLSAQGDHYGNPIYDVNGNAITRGVGIHANAGITFDLEAIRAQHPVGVIETFTGNVGGIRNGADCVSGTAIAHILVDGVSVFSRQVGKSSAQSSLFSIPLATTARFLTLATTDMGANACDIAYFGNAILQLITNSPPTADAGLDQSIRAGDTVSLDGLASSDDNTASAALTYSWNLVWMPGGSTATLASATTATPSFVADVAGTYEVELVVTDEGGRASVADTVMISSLNMAPTAAAGDDQLVLVGDLVYLDGSDSSDPESDPLTFDWTITSKPLGSMAVITQPTSQTSGFTPDVVGTYSVTLGVSDLLGYGTPDDLEVNATTLQGLVEDRIMCASDIVKSLGPEQFTNKGNQKKFSKLLSKTVAEKHGDNVLKAIKTLNKAIIRTDGCAANGVPDDKGHGRDWIVDCTAQAPVLSCLTEAMDALTQTQTLLQGYQE